MIVVCADIFRRRSIDFLWPLPWFELWKLGGDSPSFYDSPYREHLRRRLGRIALEDLTHEIAVDALDSIRGQGNRRMAAWAFGMFLDYCAVHELLAPEQEALKALAHPWQSLAEVFLQDSATRRAAGV
jgi:hypothetical protein